MKDLTKITKETYDSIYNNWETKRKYSWGPVKDFVQSVEDKEEKTFLDLGCGTGRHLELAVELGFQKKNCIGSDYSKGPLKLVDKKGFKTDLSDMKELHFEDNSIDVIVCIAAHHHLLNSQDQILALREMKRVLKPKGKILLSNWFPDKQFKSEQVRKGKFKFVDQKIVRVKYTIDEEKFDRYYYLFDEEELVNLCKKAEFTIEKKEYNRGNLYLSLV